MALIPSVTAPQPAPSRGCQGVVSPEFARTFAAEWVEAWNAHDLERILSHYADDFEIVSPVIVELMREPSGRLRGKTAVRSYWQLGLRANPPLKFELVSVFAGVGGLTITYRSVGRRMVAETFEFDAACHVVRARAHYGAPAP
ncbi:MAG TPA: nuclear transport factor 2 family protein [Vicinamibacterales bacterium]|nr:nuclear transport factor 2 family protein [Vicinamibacterales bacterium]